MAEIRDRYDAFCEASERARLRFRAGLVERLDLERIDAEYEDVTSGDALDELGQGHAAAVTEERREDARRLRVGVECAVIDARTRALTRELREREAAQTARVGRRELPVFVWQARLGAESESARRRQIQDAIDGAAENLNPLREALWEQTGQILAAFGAETRRQRAETLHPGIDYDHWGALATRLLEATESLYRDGLATALREIGAAPGVAHRGDAARVSRLAGFDRDFPAGRMLDALAWSFEGMGLRLDAVPGIQIDAAPRPRKHPRASCIAPRIPGEVIVLLAPRGGVDDWEALFHESGHAFHLAFTSPALPVERRRILDPALTETWAFLLHYRIADPAWIADVVTHPRAEAFARAVAFRKLALLRRYAAKIRYELELNALAAGADPRPLAECYAEELGEATGFVYREAGYLADTDPLFYSVDYLRAWCLEVQLAEALRARFGRRFWRERGAGELLKELWNTGSTYTADGIASELGIGPIDIEPLIAELRTALLSASAAPRPPS